MSTAMVMQLVEQLEDNLDDLEEILQPLTSQSITESTKKLPLLDRAKLYVTIVYAIESLLFSYLKVNGVDAKEHPVFRELTRVKQYFEKVKAAENGSASVQSRNMSLDKQAALRMIKHSLAGNRKIDLEKAEAEARQRLLAKRKLKMLEASMKDKAASNDTSLADVQVTPADVQEISEMIASAAEALDPEASVTESLPAADTVPETASSKKKRNKKRKQEETDTIPPDEVVLKRSKGEKKRVQKEKRRELEAAAASIGAETQADAESPG